MTCFRSIVLAVAASLAMPSAARAQLCVDAYRFVDLSPFVNHSATGDFGLGYTNLPLDAVVLSKFSGVPFQVSSSGENMIVAAGDYYGVPSTVDIPVGDKTTRIHFFGHVHAGLPFDGIHGWYVVHYGDGTSIQIPLDGNSTSRGWNIDDHCCNWRLESLPAAVVAWVDETQWPQGSAALFREYAWTNPKPQVTVDRITLVAANDGVAPMLFAITYEKKQ